MAQATYYVSWQYGNDSNSGAVDAPLASVAAVDAKIADGDRIIYQKTEKPTIMDSGGDPAYVKFTNSSATVYVYTSASVAAGSPSTDTSFDDSIWDYSNTFALDFISSRYDFDLPDQPYSQSMWFGVKSVYNGVITLNEKWYSPRDDTSTITETAVWMSGSFDVSTSTTGTSDATGFQSVDEEWQMLGGYAYDGDSTWTAPPADSDEESVFRNTYNFTSGTTNGKGTLFKMQSEYSLYMERLTAFNFNRAFYPASSYVCEFNKIKSSACYYGFWLSQGRMMKLTDHIHTHPTVAGLQVNGQCSQVYAARFIVIGSSQPNSTAMNGMQLYTTTNSYFDRYLFAGAYRNGVYMKWGCGEVVFNKPSFPNAYSGGSTTSYGPWGTDNDLSGTGIRVYQPSGFGRNPAGATHGVFAATVYCNRSSTYNQKSPMDGTTMLSITSGSNDEFHRVYFNTTDNTGNDSEISYYEKSGSGVGSSGNAIAFYPKFGDATDNVLPGVGGDVSAGEQYKRLAFSGQYGDEIPPLAIDLITKFPVSDGDALKVTFQAKKDSSFNGWFGQVFTGNGNKATGSVSQSILTTSWAEYSTTSPPVKNNTILECHFLCSGSAGQSALDHISASFV